MFTKRATLLIVAITATLFQAPLPARGADDDPASVTVQLKKGDRILFFGDSLTQLAGQEQPKQHVTKGYVRVVRETLEEKAKDKAL